MRLIRFDTDPVFGVDIPAERLWHCAIAGEPGRGGASIVACSPPFPHPASEGCGMVDVVDVISPAELAHALVADIVRLGETPHPRKGTS